MPQHRVAFFNGLPELCESRRRPCTTKNLLETNAGGTIIFERSAVSFDASSAKDTTMATITKKELIERISDAQDEKRVLVKRVIQAFLDSIIEELGNGNRLEFRDFGVFESKIRAPRRAQNPKTMDKIEVPPKRTVKFKVGRVMKRRLDAEPLRVDEATGLTVEASAPRRVSGT